MRYKAVSEVYAARFLAMALIAYFIWGAVKRLRGLGEVREAAAELPRPPFEQS